MHKSIKWKPLQRTSLSNIFVLRSCSVLRFEMQLSVRRLHETPSIRLENTHCGIWNAYTSRVREDCHNAWKQTHESCFSRASFSDRSRARCACRTDVAVVQLRKLPIRPADRSRCCTPPIWTTSSDCYTTSASSMCSGGSQTSRSAAATMARHRVCGPRQLAAARRDTRGLCLGDPEATAALRPAASATNKYPLAAARKQ